MTSNADRLLNGREVARLLNIHENTVRNWVRAGRLTVDVPEAAGQRRFRLKDVLDCARRHLSADAYEEILGNLGVPALLVGGPRDGELLALQSPFPLYLHYASLDLPRFDPHDATSTLPVKEGGVVYERGRLDLDRGVRLYHHRKD